MTTFQAGPAAPGGRVSAGKAVEMRAGSSVQVRLPVGGWQVGFRTRPDGRTVVEVAEPDGALAGLVASAAVSILSIDAGWAGWARDPGGRRWWALAIGHAPPAADQPAVTFIRRTGRGRLKLPPQTVDGLWLVQDGLWVAAATGHYTHVRLTARSTTRIRRLQPSSRLSPAPAGHFTGMSWLWQRAIRRRIGH